MTDANGTATYVYCLLSARGSPLRARGPRGLAGTGAVRALDVDDGLRLIVADAPLSRYGSEPIEQHLRDLGWVSSCAVAHERVIEHFARHGTVIPMKLFTLFPGAKRAAAFRAAVKSAAATLEPRGFDVTLTGPWPPYNFVGDPT